MQMIEIITTIHQRVRKEIRTSLCNCVSYTVVEYMYSCFHNCSFLPLVISKNIYEPGN